MRRILLTIVLLASACTEQQQQQTAPPAPQATTIADITLSGPVEITFWHSLTGANENALQALIAKFNTSNPEKITVHPIYQGSYAQAQQKTLAAVQAGTLPELSTAYAAFVSDMQKTGLVVPLDPYVASRKNGLDRASQDDLFKSFLDGERYVQFGGQLLSFPFQRAIAAMYQNDALLREINRTAPRTWSEFEDVARAATKRGPDGRAARSGWAVTLGASTFESWVVSRGGKLLSDDGRTVAWDGREGLDSLQLFQKLLGEQVAYVPKGFDYETDFAAGRVAFVHESSSFRPFLTAAMRTPVPWSLQSVPQSDATRGRTIAYGPSVVVYRSTPEKQLAAWLFVRWFSDKEQTAEWSAATAGLPLRKSASTTDALKRVWGTDTQGKQAFDLASASVPEPNVRGSLDIRAVIEELLVSVATRPIPDLDRALKDAGARANAILKDNP
ncbi:MAG: extracellular solute-binding protein [Chloroflexi bacterium]|nr:extracellular solute-binding protein [Chloroflexota bacterium]